MGEPGPAESKRKVVERHDVPFLPDRIRKGIVIKTWRQNPWKPELFTASAPTVNNCNKSDGISPIDVSNARRGLLDLVIRTFRCKETEMILGGHHARKLPTAIQSVALRKLQQIHVSEQIDDLRIPPENRLESLKGKRKGQYSIRVNDQWRICFR